MQKNVSFRFTEEQKEDLHQQIQAYFLDQFEMDLSNLQVELFIDFLNEKAGKFYYNLGVTDSIQAIKEKAEDLVMLVRD